MITKHSCKLTLEFQTGTGLFHIVKWSRIEQHDAVVQGMGEVLCYIVIALLSP